MPAKLRGMTSLEIAIIVAIVLVIAVAVGWYLYTTFTASATSQPMLNIASATLNTNGKLELILVNPGPVNVEILQIELAGQTRPPQPNTIKVGENRTVTATFSGTFKAGTVLNGRVILAGGQSFPFTVVVRSSQS